MYIGRQCDRRHVVALHPRVSGPPARRGGSQAFGAKHASWLMLVRYCGGFFGLDSIPLSERVLVSFNCDTLLLNILGTVSINEMA